MSSSAAGVFDAFCTPTLLPDDARAVAALATGALVGSVEHNGDELPVYQWGEGPPVLLVHGWGARAAHLAAYARAVAEAGCAAYAFDGPGHTRAAAAGDAPRRATLIEFGHVIATVADEIGPLHGLVGHSFGGTAAALAAAGFERPERVACERLVLVSAPDRLSYLLAAWAHVTGAGAEARAAVESETQRRFGRPVADFSVSALAGRLPSETLIIHDADDAEVPLSEAERVDRALGGGHLVVTHGLGHRKTLTDAGVTARVAEAIAAGRPIPARP